MKEQQVSEYIKSKGYTPKHDLSALASAVTDIAIDLDHDELELLQLLIENVEIPELYTHSYGFHTRRGRNIIETMQDYYYLYAQ